MYELRNLTKNERVRSVLDELICYMNDADNLKPTTTTATISSGNLQKLDQYPDNNDYEINEDYDQQQQDSSNNFVTESHDPRTRRLLQMTPSELPCDKQETRTELPLHDKMTPAYAEMNFNTNQSSRITFTVLLQFFFVLYLCFT